MRGPRTFTFNDKSSEDFGIIVNRVHRPILPALRPRKLVIPGKDGAWDFGGNTYEERTITIDCTLTQPLDKNSLIRSMALWLSQKGRLTISDEPEKYYIGRTYDQLLQEIEQLVEIGTFSIPFVCETYAYSSQDAYNETYVYDVDWLLDAGYIYPNEQSFNWVYSKQGIGLYNHSQLETDIVFVITGSVENLKITHIESGRSLSFNTTLEEQQLVIDTESMSCELDDVNITPDVDFFKIQSGNNSFLFEGVTPNCEVQYTWRHKFL